MEPIEEDIEVPRQRPSAQIMSAREHDYLERQRRTFAEQQMIEAGADYDLALGYGSAPLGVSNVTLQCIDIIAHVVDEDASVLHILANILVILWVFAFLYDYWDATRWKSVTAGVLTFYLVLMFTFFGTNGLKNERGAPRTMAWLFLAFTVVLSSAMQATMRKIRPQRIEELETIL
jgi:hypothetical protein